MSGIGCKQVFNRIWLAFVPVELKEPELDSHGENGDDHHPLDPDFACRNRPPAGVPTSQGMSNGQHQSGRPDNLAFECKYHHRYTRIDNRGKHFHIIAFHQAQVIDQAQHGDHQSSASREAGLVETLIICGSVQTMV